MKNVEILIPSWPDSSSNVLKLGVEDWGNSGCSVDSFVLHLQALQASDGFIPDYQVRCWGNVGMAIFVHSDGQVSIEIRAHDVHSANVDKLEHLVKCLKWAHKRMTLVKDGYKLTVSTLPFYLMNLCTVLGIKRTVQYHGMRSPETYAPVSETLALIVEECQRRWERLQ